jgi:hypothetical protein
MSYGPFGPELSWCCLDRLFLLGPLWDGLVVDRKVRCHKEAVESLGKLEEPGVPFWGFEQESVKSAVLRGF